MSTLKKVLGVAQEVAESGALDQFQIDARDFTTPREAKQSAGTRMQQVVTGMESASETLDRSTPEADESGQRANVISPVVIPKDSRSFRWIALVIFLGFFGIVGASVGFSGLFGPHFWLLLIAYSAYKLWQNSYVMIPDGSQALITKFGKIEATVGPGRTWLVDPRKKVGYIVNTTKEFPYNAPIRRRRQRSASTPPSTSSCSSGSKIR